MSEPRKNHLSIDGGQVKEDDHVASYKPIPESDTDFRSSKTSLSKSKEKASPDGAEEKLLSKEDEAKIVRVDMADAKYVVGDQRNGDAKIELDANKRQFSGLTKEELMKFADDPFWVRLRWCMFLLFWAMWVAMLVGAITIIVRAPKCAPRAWYEKYSMIESEGASLTELESQLPFLKSHSVHGVFVEVPTYDGDGDILTRFKNFVTKAKDSGIKVIVDLVPNFVQKSHPWFTQSESKSAPYSDYFVWAPVKNFDASGNPAPPNNWVSTVNTSAWSYSAARKEFYLHQYGAEQPDLNFRNEKVVHEFLAVLDKWMKAGADGVRLSNARHLLVNSSFPDEEMSTGRGSELAADVGTYSFWRHRETTDFAGMEHLLNQFAAAVHAAGASSESKVFTLREDGSLPEVFLLDRNVTFLQPASAAAVTVDDVNVTAATLANILGKRWPLLQLKGDAESGPELALFSMLLPATPVLSLHQLQADVNSTAMAELAPLRDDASIQHGNYTIVAVPTADSKEPKLLACARWRAAHTGYVAVLNPSGEAARADLSGVASVPALLTVHLVSARVHQHTNYTKDDAERADNVLVPAKSTVLLSYEPQAAVAS